MSATIWALMMVTALGGQPNTRIIGSYNSPYECDAMKQVRQSEAELSIVRQFYYCAPKEYRNPNPASFDALLLNLTREQAVMVGDPIPLIPR